MLLGADSQQGYVLAKRSYGEAPLIKGEKLSIKVTVVNQGDSLIGHHKLACPPTGNDCLFMLCHPQVVAGANTALRRLH
jgi:hypothetical protein